MSALVFVDTNVLIYAQNSANLKKQKQAQTWSRAVAEWCGEADLLPKAGSES